MDDSPKCGLYKNLKRSRYDEGMASTLEILTLIFTTKNSGKIIASAFPGTTNRCIRRDLSRLKKKGLIYSNEQIWTLTLKGENLLEAKTRFSFLQKNKDHGETNMLLAMFDIKESKRKERNWLREQLKIFGFFQIQKSVWQGAGPLPKEFYKRLTQHQIKDSIKFFRIHK